YFCARRGNWGDWYFD
nr:immunoglobulin heavy chain junction region [Mus musculus]